MLSHLFPRFHVRPPKGYMNDPNGPIVINGTTHLYYQYRSTMHHEAPVMWGHVSSADLVRWQCHRPAIIPDPFGGDRDGCYSGNTVLDDAGSVRAFYSGYVHDEPLQRTLVAVSTDGGHSFGPPREVVGPPRASEGIAVLRDPFVWRTPEGWRMVLGAGDTSQQAMMLLYESADLDTWTPIGRLAELSRTRGQSWDSGGMWECPQTFSVGEAEVAVVGAWTATDGILKVLSLVTSETNDTSPVALNLLDDGPNFYAASVLRESRHGPLMWGWATEGRSTEASWADGWSGMLTLPRRIVGLSSTGRVRCEPVAQMSSLRTGPARLLVNDSLEGLGAQLELAIRPPAVAEGRSVVRLEFDDHEYLEISVDYAARQVTIDRSHANNAARADEPSDIGEVIITDLDEGRMTH